MNSPKLIIVVLDYFNKISKINIVFILKNFTGKAVCEFSNSINEGDDTFKRDPPLQKMETSFIQGGLIMFYFSQKELVMLLLALKFFSTRKTTILLGSSNVPAPGFWRLSAGCGWVGAGGRMMITSLLALISCKVKAHQPCH